MDLGAGFRLRTSPEGSRNQTKGGKKWVDGHRPGFIMAYHSGAQIEERPAMAAVSLVREKTAVVMAEFHTDTMG